MPTPDTPPTPPAAALPPGFVLGTATSAFQVEGAVDVDGRGPSSWDVFATQPGVVADGSDGSSTADHYHHVERDVALLRELGLPGYRFSVGWPRVMPDGHTVNGRGLDFYDRLVDRLLEAGLQPMATLYHGDVPQALEADGGWLNPATVDAFAAYAAVVGERLADRVPQWVPINAPSLVTLSGYGTGDAAPGLRLGLDCLHAAHHLLLGHGRAVQALRAAGARSVGCANHHSPMWPASDEPADVGATKLADAVVNGLFLEPMLLGRYPQDLAPFLLEIGTPGDLATIRQPLDFYGVGYFRPLRVAAAEMDAVLPFVLGDALGYPTTDAGYPVVPEALREWLILLRARFRAALPPLVVVECGGAFADDARRIEFLDGHLRAVADAAQRGVDVRGFYAWSLLDVFSWAGGMEPPYGLVGFDPVTKERAPRPSFDWYRQVGAAQSDSVG